MAALWVALLELVASLPPCLIGMESCSGAHHWAREFADAQAICEAVSRPNMRFVPIKSEEQQSRLMVPRARQWFVVARTATLNRGLLSEFGIAMPLKASTVRRRAMVMLENLPGYANTVIGDLLSEVSHLDRRIVEYDTYIRAMAKGDTPAQQLMGLCGVGEATATALVPYSVSASVRGCRSIARYPTSNWALCLKT